MRYSKEIILDNIKAEYKYDILPARCRTEIRPSTKHYYYNDGWQVLCEYAGASADYNRSYVYGSYIDEAVRMSDKLGYDYYYAHDHLYSPAALIDNSGAVVERYEYDAYGNAYVLN